MDKKKSMAKTGTTIEIFTSISSPGVNSFSSLTRVTVKLEAYNLFF